MRWKENIKWIHVIAGLQEEIVLALFGNEYDVGME
jgi:hypothetical protein